MRVVVDYRPALRARTGIGEYVHELARAIRCTAPDGESLTLFSSSWADRVDASVTADLPDVQIVDARVPVRALTWAWHRLEWPPVEWFAGRCDVAHSPTPLLMPTKRAAQVVTVFDLFFLDRPGDVGGAGRRDFAELTQHHVRRADQVIAGSTYAAELVAGRLQVPRERITATPLGAPPWARSVRQSRADSLGSSILFIGTLEPRKNLGLLLDAYAALVTARTDTPPLVIAGRVTPEAQPWLSRLEVAPLAGRVSLRGYVSDAERRALYAEARVVALPSLDEGFGLPALEAMACGVPVVAAAVGALPEVVGDAGIVLPADAPRAWTAALDHCLDDDVARAMRDRGLARAALFTWERAAAATRDAYAAAIARRARRV